ncbi:MAG: hypothetical protein LBL86_11420 [Coriobacteriales bacterium]|nr:hypothetical protein [Coriobacteriales bacterium]
MPVRKNLKVIIIVFAVLLMGFLVVACGGQSQPNPNSNTGAAESTAISVNNDTVTQAENTPTVTDPNAGKIVGDTVSEEPTMDPGTTVSPGSYNPEDIMATATGAVLAVPHGDTNGDACLTCHESGTGGASVIPYSHVENKLTNDYCRSCHQNA